MEKQNRICDICGNQFVGGKPDGVYSNLNVYMAEYNLKIDVTKAGMVTELCRKCLRKIVLQALSLEDPYFGLLLETDSIGRQARKRKQRKSCPVSGT